jgi:hypothetical protein
MRELYAAGWETVGNAAQRSRVVPWAGPGLTERPPLRHLTGVPRRRFDHRSPSLQSISLGFEGAMYLAGLVARRDLPLRDMLDRYELYSYEQSLCVYMRSKMIKHTKDLFESLDDPLALLEKLHIY